MKTSTIISANQSLTINSTVTLRPIIVNGATLKQANSLIRRMIRESTQRQNAAIKANLSINCTAKTMFSNAAARALAMPRPITSGRKVPSKIDEIDRSEAYRILSTYQKRLALAVLLKQHKWNLSYIDCKLALGFVDYQLYQNVLRSKKLPTVPKIKTAIIPTSKADDQFSKIEYTDSQIILKNFALWARRVDLIFEIPTKLAGLHPNIKKITRPTIRISDGEPVFDFVFQEEIIQEKQDNNSVLSLDLGVSKVFSTARVYSDGKYSEEFLPSIFTDRHSRTAIRLSREIKLVSVKNHKRELLGCPKSIAIEQELVLREKKKRVLEQQDWSAAADLLAHSNPGEQVIIENLKFNSGGNLGPKRFRHSSVSSKLEHAASRRGKKVKRVSAALTSQLCPQCQSLGIPDKNRIFDCKKCSWVGDRDYTAAIIIGQRGLGMDKFTAKKNRPTPKRPRENVRRRHLVPQKNTMWTAFTGASPAVATCGIENSAATSVKPLASVAGLTPIT